MGARCLVYPNVTIRERTRIGARVIIHSGAVIGADGFGFEPREGKNEKVPQIGIVQIDDDVEIGANTTIDRARFGRTWIQEGVKIDNLVQIAHNVVMGRNSMVAAQTGIAGSVRIGEHVMMGGQVGIIGHIEIGDATMIGAKSGVSKNIEGGTWWATPAIPLMKRNNSSLGAPAWKIVRSREKNRREIGIVSPQHCENARNFSGGEVGKVSAYSRYGNYKPPCNETGHSRTR